jgi:hypothetical protein
VAEMTSATGKNSELRLIYKELSLIKSADDASFQVLFVLAHRRHTVADVTRDGQSVISEIEVA